MTLAQLARLAEAHGRYLVLTFEEDAMETMDDLKVMALAKDCVSTAVRYGMTDVFVPMWLMRLLIEKAERPHD